MMPKQISTASNLRLLICLVQIFGFSLNFFIAIFALARLPLEAALLHFFQGQNVARKIRLHYQKKPYIRELHHNRHREPAMHCFTEGNLGR